MKEEQLSGSHSGLTSSFNNQIEPRESKLMIVVVVLLVGVGIC